MKYSDMDLKNAPQYEASQDPRGKTHKPKPTPAEQPYSQQFRLFRLTKPLDNGCTHAGHVWLGQRCWQLTAKVVEVTDVPGGPPRKEFHGSVEAPGAAIGKKLSRTAGQGNHGSGDLVAQAEGMPFDDPLPPF